MLNYSFWADEAYISVIASQLALNKLSSIEAFSLPGITYQRLHVFVLSLFFKVFGVSELIARLPSILGFLLGVVVIFFLARRFSSVYGGLLSSFLYAFSHLNLAYATQAKPYITIEAILLLVLYLLSDKKKVNHALVIILCSVATLLHSIGVFLWIIYFMSIILRLKNLKIKKLNKEYVAIAIIVIGIAGLFIFPMIISLFRNGLPFKYNNLYQITKLFTYKYLFISSCAFFGFVWNTKKYKSLHFEIITYVLIVLIFVAFVSYTFPIRYVLSFFGILFLYFGIFWAKVGEKYDNNLKFSIPYFAKASKGKFNLKLSGKAIIPLTVLILLYASGYKIVRWPQAYYNPNIDKYGDVQIANYKDFYGELKQKFPDYKNIYVVNDTFDVEYWYFGRYSNAYFMKFVTKPYQHPTVKQAMIYGSLDDFKKVMVQHPQGLLIMEDWQSFLPDDIKEYAKKNLKLEFRVESLKEAPDDPWPLALYSWGF